MGKGSTPILMVTSTLECTRFDYLKLNYCDRLNCLQNDLENGNGTFVWADGYKYTGAFINGLKTGYGEYYYKNGDSYKGMFQAGKFHGEGEYSWSNGAKYVGAHDMDQRTGFGTMIDPDGAEFSGKILICFESDF